MFGRGLRYVATLDGAWLALPGWQAGALRVRVRDRWIGWPAEQKLRRLHLIDKYVPGHIFIVELNRYAVLVARR